MSRSVIDDIPAEEKEELVTIARGFGLHKVVRALLGEDEDEEDDLNADPFESGHLPSQNSRRAVRDTLNWMGCSWGE